MGATGIRWLRKARVHRQNSTKCIPDSATVAHKLTARTKVEDHAADGLVALAAHM
jgi:hypothetical protein